MEERRWYQLEVSQVLARLDVTQEGLSEAQVVDRLSRFGPNALPDDGGVGWVTILIHQFMSPLIYILLVAGIVTVVLEAYVDAGVIFAIVGLNAVIGFFQEYKAEESVKALKKMVVPRARVLRSGREVEIASHGLVPGDIVLLASGLKVPADIRLFHASELKADEALLTGESVPVEKGVAAIPADKLMPGDQNNMAFMGTVIVNGRARGIVVETGSATMLGEIARDVKDVKRAVPPLQHKIERFAKAISAVVLVSCVLLFVLGIWVGESVAQMFMTAVAAAVAAVPEGLPIVVTITMAIGVARMARRNAVVRKLAAVETLGSTTVIGSDKTGTLTKNEMTVTLIYDGDHTYEVTGSGYEPRGEILKDGIAVPFSASEALTFTLRIGLLCTESSVYRVDGRYHVDGDPTEGALIVASMKAGLDPDREEEGYPEIGMIPFESELGYMATLHRHAGVKLIYVKGAPERIVEMCSRMLDGRPVQRKEILAVADAYAGRGLRVLAMAVRELSRDGDGFAHEDLRSEMSFVGMQGMIDPPRPEAVEAVAACTRAGIRTVMITGDHVVTAGAIAREIGIGQKSPRALTGKEIESLTDEELYEQVDSVSVYARVSPEHKLRIAKQLMRHGEIVAVTGDGVNDAPALKASHIGIAMGRTGTDVAREAADMVLTDDNFASIYHAVREGRIVFDNVRKVVFFLIPTGVAAILSIFVAVAMGLPIPYVPAQLLWINLVTNGLQDVALAFEPGERNVGDRGPRNPREGLMSRVLIERTILVGAIISLGIIYTFLDSLNRGETLEKARTIAVTTMVFFQFFQAWNSRSESLSIFQINLVSNPFLFYSMIAAFFAQLAVLYVPSFQWIFRTVPLVAADWIQIGIVTSTIVLAVEIDKWLRRPRRMEAAA